MDKEKAMESVKEVQGYSLEVLEGIEMGLLRLEFVEDCGESGEIQKGVVWLLEEIGREFESRDLELVEVNIRLAA